MRWIMFDYGGVICRPQPEEDVGLLARAAGCSPAELEAAYWPLRPRYDRSDLDSASFWQKVGAAVGRTYTGSQIAELARLDTASWLHCDPATVALIEKAARAGHRLALLSNAPTDVAAAVAALPVAAHFEHMAFSCHLRLAKPDPACYLAVLAMLGAVPEEVIFVDDRPENVAAAAAMGMQGIRFTGLAGTWSELERRGVILR